MHSMRLKEKAAFRQAALDAAYAADADPERSARGRSKALQVAPASYLEPDSSQPLNS
jgi:hypothetical protein